MKKCTKCKRVQPKENFIKKNDEKDGLSGHCKECRKYYYQAHRKRQTYKLSDFY